METRTIKELLNLMLNKQHLFTEGLCRWAFDMKENKIITTDECANLISFIRKNRPEYKWHNPYMLFNDNTSSFYWACGCIAPRVKWIKKHIKLLEV